MRTKLTLIRPDATYTDLTIFVDAGAHVADVADAIASRDPQHSTLGPQTITVNRSGTWNAIDPTMPFQDAGIVSGSHISLIDSGSEPARLAMAAGQPTARFRASGGTDDARVFTVTGRTTSIGRGEANGIALTDPSVSKSHAVIDILDDAVTIIDQQSANGLVIDGGMLSRATLRPGWSVALGDVTLTLIDVVGVPGRTPREPASIPFNRSPRVEARFPGTEFPSPEPPIEQDRQPFPWLIMIAPLIMGAVLFSITQSPLSIAFVALSPVLMLANWLTTRGTRRRRMRDQIRRFGAQMESLRTKLATSLTLEHQIRLKEAPSTDEVVAAALGRTELLWTRRPEHWSFLNVRIGTGTLASRSRIADIPGQERALPEYVDELSSLADEFALVPAVPVFENLHDSGSIGVAGPVGAAEEAAAALITQLTGLHSPDELVVSAIVGPSTGNSFEWMRWLPHTSSPSSPLNAIPHLTDSESSTRVLIAALEELVDARAPASKRDAYARRAMAVSDSAVARAAQIGEDDSAALPPSIPLPAIVVLIAHDCIADRGRLVQLMERAPDAGVYGIWLEASSAQLPAVCRTFLEFSTIGSLDARIGHVRQGEQFTPVQPERIDHERCAAFARSLAPVTDAGAYSAEASDVPRSVSLVTLLDSELLTSTAAVIDRWAQNESLIDRSAAPSGRHRPGRLRAIIGQGGTDAMHLDLRAQGPHALVGGTTGSGKSEFLQTWVLAMAAEYSPDRVTFLFVDYKGGSAFADCVSLPHSVGLVTDLSPHLVRRALTSLRAELHYREHLFNRKKVKDILEMESLRDSETPPALVIVIDEFAALVSDVPEFVDGVVDIAQRGRSLGIHLILATQRPAGVIRDNLRANTNLRIALRMADEADSVDVLGTPAAAHFDPSIPGRASAKTGPGRLTPFQAAYAGGWTTGEKPAPSIDVAELRFGSPVLWEVPDTEDAPRVSDPGPTDQTRLVRSIGEAFIGARLPSPRRPWMPELAQIYDLARLPQRTDTKLVLGVADLPHRQAQEPVSFLPDIDGHLAIYGTGGSGKSTALRTLAISAGITPRGGIVDVYGLDFGSGGLRMLEPLPHVGAVIAGDDSERVVRLFRMLQAELTRRAALFGEARASTIDDYRASMGSEDLARILLLVDGFPAFRAEYEVGAGRAERYAAFLQLLSDGRPFGIHIALTADRAASVPSAVGASISRRVVLRLAEETGYTLLNVEDDILSPTSPSGRAIIDGWETQIAVLGGSRSTVDQVRAIADLGATIAARRRPAEQVRALPRKVLLSELPTAVEGEPVLGISDETLEPVGFEPAGAMLIAGAPSSGRTNALLSLASALSRAQPESELYFIGGKRSRLAGLALWTQTALDIDETTSLARELSAGVGGEPVPHIAVFVEGFSDFLSTPADAALVELIKLIKRSDHFFVAEAETAGWGSSWPLLGEVKSARRGIILQPDPMDGDQIMRTPFPKVSRAEFPPGRGYLVRGGRVTRVQMPLVDGEDSPSTKGGGRR